MGESDAAELITLSMAYVMFRGWAVYCARVGKLVTKKHFISTRDKPPRDSDVSFCTVLTGFRA